LSNNKLTRLPKSISKVIDLNWRVSKSHK